jgi:hypothetical protein
MPCRMMHGEMGKRVMPRFACLCALLTFSMIASCDSRGPGMKLSNGCYYAGERPVIRIIGNEGTVLVPGNVQNVLVSRRADPAASVAIFSPGFFIESPSNIRAVQQSQFPRYHYMMSPSSSVPTILMPTTSEELIALALGAPC